ncbi:hypothetical protein ACJX0J_028820, partial [Zea mays]
NPHSVDRYTGVSSSGHAALQSEQMLQHVQQHMEGHIRLVNKKNYLQTKLDYLKFTIYCCMIRYLLLLLLHDILCSLSFCGLYDLYQWFMQEGQKRLNGRSAPMSNRGVVFSQGGLGVQGLKCQVRVSRLNLMR